MDPINVQVPFKKGPFSEIEKNIIFFLGQRMSVKAIAEKLQRNRSSVNYIVKKFKQTGKTSRKEGSGSTLKFNSDFCSKVVQYFVDHPEKTYHEAIIEENWPCSKMFISQLLAKHNMHAFVASKKPALSEHDIEQRRTFSTLTSTWTDEDWLKVAFSDEKTIQSYANGRVKVKRFRGASFDPKHTKEQVRYQHLGLYDRK